MKIRRIPAWDPDLQSTDDAYTTPQRIPLRGSATYNAGVSHDHSSTRATSPQAIIAMFQEQQSPLTKGADAAKRDENRGNRNLTRSCHPLGRKLPSLDSPQVHQAQLLYQKDPECPENLRYVNFIVCEIAHTAISRARNRQALRKKAILSVCVWVGAGCACTVYFQSEKARM